MSRAASLPGVRLRVVHIESIAIAIQAELANLSPERWPGTLARLGALAGAARESAAEAIEVLDGGGDRDGLSAVTRV